MPSGNEPIETGNEPIVNIESIETGEPVKRKRGRPRKNPVQADTTQSNTTQTNTKQTNTKQNGTAQTKKTTKTESTDLVPKQHGAKLDKDKVVDSMIERKTRARFEKIKERYGLKATQEENQTYIMHALELMCWEDIDIKDVAAIQQRIEEYFVWCVEKNEKPSVPGLALAIGIHRMTLWRWSKDTNDPRNKTICKAYALLEMLATAYLQDGKINPVAGAYILNNGFGYSNTQELVIRPGPPLGEQQDLEKLRQKYADDMVPDA